MNLTGNSVEQKGIYTRTKDERHTWKKYLQHKNNKDYMF